jgi:hypothetical protein
MRLKNEGMPEAVGRFFGFHFDLVFVIDEKIGILVW